VYGPDYVPCAWCSCLRPPHALTIELPGGPICTDALWCTRSKRIREEVEADFERLSRNPAVTREIREIIDWDEQVERFALNYEVVKSVNRDHYRATYVSAAKSFKCGQCGKAHSGEGGRRKYCSRECMNRAYSKQKLNAKRQREYRARKKAQSEKRA
jgi:hypothetical protein